VPTTNDTDPTDINAIAKTMDMMSTEEHIANLHRRIPRNEEWNIFLELMIHIHATLTPTPEELVTKLVEKKAAIKRDNWLTPDALLMAKKGGRCSRGSKVGNSPKREKREDKRDNKEDRKEKDLREWCH
jgi:phosphosulfolactate phosphohydrolase-like enzyme